MSGNVWEWCSDYYRADAYKLNSQDQYITNPKGPEKSFDPLEPYSKKRALNELLFFSFYAIRSWPESFLYNTSLHHKYQHSLVFIFNENQSKRF